MREISFTGKLSYDDYKKYNAYHFKRRYIIIAIILFLAYYVVCTGAMLNLFINYKFLIIGIISFSLSLFTSLSLILIRNRKIKAIYNSSQRIKTECIYKTIFKGILIKSENGTSLLKWKNIIKVTEKNEMVILYTSPVQALIIARGYFDTNQDFFDFKNIIKEKVKKSSSKDLLRES